MPPILPFGGLSFLIHLSILVIGWVRDRFATASWSHARIVRGFGTPREGDTVPARIVGWSLPPLIALPFLITIGSIGLALTHLSGNTAQLFHSFNPPVYQAIARSSYPMCHEAPRLAIYTW